VTDDSAHKTVRLDLGGDYTGTWVEIVDDPQWSPDFFRRYPRGKDRPEPLPTIAFLKLLTKIVVATNAQDDAGAVDLRTVEGWGRMPLGFLEHLAKARRVPSRWRDH
jgi:hypothetical protein